MLIAHPFPSLLSAYLHENEYICDEKQRHMGKYLLSLSLTALILFALPLSIAGIEAANITDIGTQSVTVTVSDTAVHVSGASGMTLSVYNVAGVRVRSIRIDSNEKSIVLDLPKGCYILKIGDKVRKISIR